MNPREFLQTILGDRGKCCIIGIKNKDELTDSDERPEQLFFDNLDDAVAAAFELDEKGINAFFAVSTFQTSKTRAAFNVEQIKSFFLDIDCGPNKDYATQLDGLKALRLFCREMRLPKPMVVNSGRGLHVYWVLTQPVTREEWKPVAERFKEVCREEGMHVDMAVPADPARVLRVLGTHNHKDKPDSKLVTLIGEVPLPVEFGTFKMLLGESPFKKEYTPREADPMMMALAGNYQSRFKTIMMKTISGEGCAQLKDIVMNQATMSEPQWRAGLSIASHCVDRDKAIHRISEKYPDYSAQATEMKVRGIKGPYLCARFDEYNPGVCPSCKHWNKIKSPISLGREVSEMSDEARIVVEPIAGLPTATRRYEIPKRFPKGYGCAGNGGIYKEVKNDDGTVDQAVFYHHPIYVVKNIKDPELGVSVVMRLHLPKDGVQEFTIPLSAISSKDEFRKLMAMHGVAVLKVDSLMEYTMSWVNMLQMEVAFEQAKRQFGWTDEACTSFVLGDKEVFADQIAHNPPAGNTAGLFPAFEPRGTLEGWKNAVNFYNRPGFELHQFILGTAFGSPLMQFLPINGAMFHIHSPDSGLGKTTALNAAASVWGDPGMLVLEQGDTPNSKMNRAETYKNLPLYMDEMTNTEPKALSDMAYQIPNGVQKNRLGPKGNVERFRGVPWKFICVTTGNTSMIERIGLYKALPKAEAQRILEHRATVVRNLTKEETDLFSRNLEANSGHAGIIYIQYVLNNLEAVKEICDATQLKIDAAAGLTMENRFWSALASRTISGLIIAKKAGLIDYDVAPIANWIVKVLKDARTDTTTMGGDVETIITDYLASNYNNILRIKSTDDARKQEETGLETILNPVATPRLSLVGRYEYDVFKLYLLPKPLKEWCGKQQINYGGLVEGLANSRAKATKGKQRLGKGTHVNLPPVTVLVLDCTEFLKDDIQEQFVPPTAL
jgi:hypothetical protein